MPFARRPVWVRVVASVAAVPLAFAALDWLHVLVKSIYKGDGWFRDEVALVVAGVALATIGLAMLASRRGVTPELSSERRGEQRGHHGDHCGEALAAYGAHGDALRAAVGQPLLMCVQRKLIARAESVLRPM